jgi:hypothetical protein
MQRKENRIAREQNFEKLSVTDSSKEQAHRGIQYSWMRAAESIADGGAPLRVGWRLK